MAKTAEELNQFVKENLRGCFENEKGLFGFVDSERDLELLLLRLRSKHFDFSVRHSEERSGPKSYFFSFGDIPLQTTPFVINNAIYKVCSYGSEYYKDTQDKIKAKKESDALLFGSPPVGKQRKARQKKKTNCPGRMVVKELTFFPDYQIEAKEEHGKKASQCRGAVRKRLKEDIASGRAVWRATRYFVYLSHFLQHTGHPQMAATELGYDVDPKNVTSTQKKIKTGITSLKDAASFLRFSMLPPSLKGVVNPSVAISKTQLPEQQESEEVSAGEALPEVTNDPVDTDTSGETSTAAEIMPSADCPVTVSVASSVAGSEGSHSESSSQLDRTPGTTHESQVPPATKASSTANTPEKHDIEDLRRDCRSIAHAITRASFQVENEECLMKAIGLMQHSFELLQYGSVSLKGATARRWSGKKRLGPGKKLPIGSKRVSQTANNAASKKTKKTVSADSNAMTSAQQGGLPTNDLVVTAVNPTHHDELMRTREDLNVATEQTRAVLNLPTVFTIDGSHLGLQGGQLEMLDRTRFTNNLCAGTENDAISISRITSLLQQAGVSLPTVSTESPVHEVFARASEELNLAAEQTRTVLSLPSVLTFDGTHLSVQSGHPSQQEGITASNASKQPEQLLIDQTSKSSNQVVSINIVSAPSLQQTCSNLESNFTMATDSRQELTIAAEQTVSSLPGGLIFDNGTLSVQGTEPLHTETHQAVQLVNQFDDSSKATEQN